MQGTHEKLMAAGHVYYDMWQAQAAADTLQKMCAPVLLEEFPSEPDGNTLVLAGTGM